MKDNDLSREDYAHLARVTIVIPSVKSSYTPEELIEYLYRQREDIAKRIETS